MELFVKIRDDENGTVESLYLCEYKSEQKEDDDEPVFITIEQHHNTDCFTVLVNEGYVKTFYYYPVNRYSVIHVEKIEE